MWGILAVVYGQLVKEFFENNLHTLGFLLFLLFLGALISYVFVWNRAKRKSFDQEIT
jgi:cbb3-type cytochrome oxidase subunit 3